MGAPSWNPGSDQGFKGNTGWRALALAVVVGALLHATVARAQSSPPPLDAVPPAGGPPPAPVAPPPANALPGPAAPAPANAPPPFAVAPAPPQPPAAPLDAPPTAPAPAPPPELVATPLPPRGTGRAPAEDPQADRVVLLPTAYTHPEGTVFFSSYDIAILQAGYAFTDDTQVTLTALPIPRESFTVLDLTLKTALVKTGGVRVAALGSASGGVGSDIGLLFIGRVGGVVQLCLEPGCTSSFSLSSNVVLAGALLLMANGVGGIWRVGRKLSLLGELATLVPVGTEGGQFNGAALGGGVRFHFEHWGFDLTLIRALDTTGPVAPLLTATYRSAP